MRSSKGSSFAASCCAVAADRAGNGVSWQHPGFAPRTWPMYSGRHHADAVEWRAVDQLRAHDSIDQHVLLGIDGAIDLEGLEKQRCRGKPDHLRLREACRNVDLAYGAAGHRKPAGIFGESEPALHASGRGAGHVTRYIAHFWIVIAFDDDLVVGAKPAKLRVDRVNTGLRVRGQREGGDRNAALDQDPHGSSHWVVKHF